MQAFNNRTYDLNWSPDEGLRVETLTWTTWIVLFFEGNNMWNIKQRKNQNHSSKNTAFFSSTVNDRMQKQAPPLDWRFPHLNLCHELRLIWVTNHNWRGSPNTSERALPTSYTSVLLLSCHINHRRPAGWWTQAHAVKLTDITTLQWIWGIRRQLHSEIIIQARSLYFRITRLGRADYYYWNSPWNLDEILASFVFLQVV